MKWERRSRRQQNTKSIEKTEWEHANKEEENMEDIGEKVAKSIFNSELESIMKIENTQTNYILSPTYEKNEKWVQEYIKQFGTEPSFF